MSLKGVKVESMTLKGVEGGSNVEPITMKRFRNQRNNAIVTFA